MIPLHWLSGFDARELGRIISGEDSAHLDVDDLAANTSFRGGYDPNSQSVQWLWNVLRSFNPQQQRDFLMFVTSCPRAPFLVSVKTLPVLQSLDLYPDRVSVCYIQGSQFIR